MARKLTPQQQAFAVEVATGDCTATDAALSAGYSPASATKIASQLLDNPRVVAEIERIKGKATAASVGSKAEALDRIWKLACDAADEGARRDAYQGYELWLKATGNLVEKREVKHEDVELDWGDVVDPGGGDDDEG